MHVSKIDLEQFSALHDDVRHKFETVEHGVITVNEFNHPMIGKCVIVTSCQDEGILISDKEPEWVN